MTKKVLLVWDFDGPIGQINASYPYNFGYSLLNSEIENVHAILDILKQYQIKSCFAITGFSAEKGEQPYVFPALIKKIHAQGHEVASHSWRHEWIPIFKKDQIIKSLRRSKLALENLVGKSEVKGFVPPHNRPMTWLKKGALSYGDRGLFMADSISDNEILIKTLQQECYQWIRISHQNIFHKLKILKPNPTGKVYKYKGVLVLENHYTGFDEKVIQHILSSKEETFTISAHPLMLSFENKAESKANFFNFLEKLTSSNQDIQFVTPASLL